MGTLTANTTSTLSNLLPSFYDRVLLETFDKTVRFQQFANKKRVPLGEGKEITWNRYSRLGLGYKLTEGTRPSSTALSTVQVSALLEQYGQWTALSDFIDLTSIGDVAKEAVERLGRSAAETLDTVIQNAIVFHANTTAVSVTHYIKQSAQQYFSTSQSAAQHVDSESVLAVSDLNAITAKLRGWDVPALDSAQSYVGITSEEVLKFLRDDSTWQNWNQYNDSTPLFMGEVGKIHGVRLVNTTLNRISSGSTTGTHLTSQRAAAHATVIFGREYFGSVDLGGKDVEILTSSTPDVSDPLNQISTIGWKAFFTAKVLNVSAGVVAWTGVDELLDSASETSAWTDAVRGTRLADPTTST
jgi:N4-gp56 family major capsid protein